MTWFNPNARILAALIAGILSLPAIGLIAQEDYRLQVELYAAPAEFQLKRYIDQRTVNDTAEAHRALEGLVDQLHMDGYLSASFDSIQLTNRQVIAHIFVGDRYRWLVLQAPSVERIYLRRTKISNRTKSRMRTGHLKRLKAEVLANLENNGYPFAQVFLEDWGFHGTDIEANLSVDKRQQVLIDTIRIEGEAGISQAFLERYLNIAPADVYNESSIRAIRERIAELNFVSLAGDPQVGFTGDKANVSINLEPRPASRFNFLLGVLPSSSNKLQVYGEAMLHLVNPWGGGRELLLDWERLRARTQKFRAGVSYPYVLNLPVGISGNLEIYKFDSLFLDVIGGGALQYPFSANHYLEMSYRQHNTNVLSIDTGLIRASGRLPEYLDMRSFTYNVTYHFHAFDNFFNPLQGFASTAVLGVGSRRIQANNTILGLNPDPASGEAGGLYEGVDMNVTIYRAGVTIEKFWKIGTNSTVQTKLQSQALFARNILQNEMYRIGGNKLLRGFDEESIFTPYYSIATLEYRFRFSTGSYFYTFVDGALIERRTQQSETTIAPFGFGTGVALETKAGIFGITYALGKLPGTALQIRNGKIHFGYVNYF